MNAPLQNKKSLIRAAAVALPVLLLLYAGWLVKSNLHRGANDQASSPARAQKPEAPAVGGSQARAPETSQVTGAHPTAPAALNSSHPEAQARQAANETTHGREAPSSSSSSGAGQAGGSSNVASGASPQQAMAPARKVSSVPAQETPADGCFALSFTHKPMASHSSDDECSHHRNLIKLGRLDAVPASVCIRVNGTPVRHEAVPGQLDEFVIGAVAGPHDVITARFCVGKARCNEGCPYPKQDIAKKDEFLDALGAGADADGDATTAKWEATDGEKNAQVNQALDGEIKKEVEERDLAKNRAAPGNTRLQIFKDWISGTEAPACGSHPEAARTTASR